MPIEPFPESFKLLLAVWFFALGGCIGSFLNVVVYRLPLGLSLSWPGSHCPACKHAIRWYDNVPILGWVFLGGRCRDCRLPISMRYPVVEAITAAMFLTVGSVEGLSLGANLPPRWVAIGDETILHALSLGETAGILAYHFLLLSTLLAAALVEYDGHRLPVRLMLPALVVGFVAPLFWPHLHPVPAVADWWRASEAMLDGTAGLALGLILGEVARWVIGPRNRRGLVFGPACVGLFLGWQAAAALGLWACMIHWGAEVVRRWWPGLRRLSPGFWILAGVVAWILAWGVLVKFFS